MVAIERAGFRIEARATSAPLLEVRGLRVCFGSAERPLPAVDGVSFDVRAGETLCVVGESGSGKTVMALSILRLEQHKRARISSGEIVLGGRGLVGASRAELEALRGRRVAMIFQEPMTALDPVFSIGEQLVETIRRHERVSRADAWERAVGLLTRVRIPDARARMRQMPGELSGGMQQRVMIAMALSCSPELLIADEPTTALDVTTQAQILALLQELQRDTGMAILLITHDLAVAAMMADRLVVMYAGRVVERAPVDKLFRAPEHPYTRGLIRSAIPLDGVRGAPLDAIAGAIPRLHELPSGCRFQSRCQSASARCGEESPPLIARRDHAVACFHAGPSQTATRAEGGPLVALKRPAGASSGVMERVEAGEAAARAPVSSERPVLVPRIEALGLGKSYGSRRLFGRERQVRALDGVSLSIAPGETFGLVGESGCGKSTLGRVLLQLESPSEGEVRFDGAPLRSLRGKDRLRARREMQMIFQDPYGSIDPRWRVHDVIAEPLVAHGEKRADRLRERVAELLELVGLPLSASVRYAHEFSGGQRQRIGIARALAQHPKFIVADEAVSALDLSVQAQIINLLLDLRSRLGLTCLFIGHGLNVVRHLSDRIGVMYLGRLVEVAEADELFRRPFHHYTHALLAAVPSGIPGQALRATPGELPSPSDPPPGCHFHPRCPAASARCRSEAPALRLIAPGRLAACHHPLG
jgi:peptide/nickel transport system ATP-binding protein